MRMQPLVVCLTLLTLTAPALSAAQESDHGDGRVSLAFLGGISTGSGETGAAVGATLLSDVSRRVGIEARSVYMDRGPGSSAFDLTANVLVKLLDAGRANPYLAMGGGAYVAMFDLGNRQLFGMMGNDFTRNNTAQAGPTFAGSGMPMFYARRMGAITVPSDGWHMRSFTDPTLSFGGGVNVDLRRGMSLRPDVRMLIVFGGVETFTTTTATLSFGYRF